MTIRTMGTIARTRDSLDRLVRCAQEDEGTALWWVCLAHHLDELRDELAGADIQGLSEQITADAPHFAAAARRLPVLDAQAQEEVGRVRLLVAQHAGSTEAAAPVRREVDLLMRKVRTLYRLSDTLMFDAYERDLGGD